MISADFRKNSPTAPQILIVDDEPTQQLFTRRILQKEGYRVIDASNGQECLEICLTNLPDIVLLDAMMPVIEGFTCCAQLQENPLTQNIPVLMLTNLDDKNSVNQAFEVGATDYVTKPNQAARANSASAPLDSAVSTLPGVNRKLREDSKVIAEFFTRVDRAAAPRRSNRKLSNRRSFPQCQRVIC
jgi:PleD family two-component response regulator